MTILIPVLGDQLSHNLPSLQAADRQDAVILMMEVWSEATSVKHHKKKIAFIFSAMRHFAHELRADGWTVDYISLDNPSNTQSFSEEVARATKKHKAKSILTTAASEYRVRLDQESWAKQIGCPFTLLEDTRFLYSRAEFEIWAKNRKSLRMEYFYREMRQKTGFLLNPDGTPTGGQWNYDHENREKPPAGTNYPAPKRFEPDTITKDVLALVRDKFCDHFGDLLPFNLPINRKQALAALAEFIDTGLPNFGRYQDAMIANQDYLYHSSLSLCLNVGLLTPTEVCKAAEEAYQQGTAPLNSVEGFIRQIIGWREYVRGMYWHTMPHATEQNALSAERPLPDFFWTGKTNMRCIAESVSQTKREAYAHHIQRLMVLGNFALLAGINPQELSDWFLVVYFDAFEWVELPNVLGMSQYADGGKIASKPYVGSGAYINRMSDYCGTCHFKVTEKTGQQACPFNALYWDFLARHETRFAQNMRMKNMYATWNRFSPDKQQDYRQSAAYFLDALTPASSGWAR